MRSELARAFFRAIDDGAAAIVSLRDDGQPDAIARVREATRDAERRIAELCDEHAIRDPLERDGLLAQFKARLSHYELARTRPRLSLRKDDAA